MISLARMVHKCCQTFMTTTTRTLASKPSESTKFETVFSFPFVQYVALFNRLKTYHLYGSCVAVPSSAVLEMLHFLPDNSIFSASYIAATGLAVLTIASVPFKNIIGFLYISEDNQFVKISSVNFWGKRVDRIISADEWVPLLDMKPRVMDGLYLAPQLTDNTRYKLFVKLGNVLNSKKMGQVLE